jgi:hypothetical protein
VARAASRARRARRPATAGGAPASPRSRTSSCPRRSPCAISRPRARPARPSRRSAATAPDGRDDVWYIVTEAADYDVAKVLGVNFAPKLAFGADTDGSQEVTLRRGRLAFRGAVDFAPERFVSPGTGRRRSRPRGAPRRDRRRGVVLARRHPDGLGPQRRRRGQPDRRARPAAEHRPQAWRRAAAAARRLAGRRPLLLPLRHRLVGPDRGGDRGRRVRAAAGQPAELRREQRVRPQRAARFSPNANGETGLDNPQRQG